MILAAISILTIATAENLAEIESNASDIRCGIYCLTVAAKSLGQDTDQDTIEKMLGDPLPAGYSMDRLNTVARTIGLSTTMAKSNLAQLKYRYDVLGERFVCITVIDGDHFVLLSDIESGAVSLCDPPRTYSIDTQVFEKIWGGEVLLVSGSYLETEEFVAMSHHRRRTVVRIGFGLMTSVLILGSMFTLHRIRKT